MVGSGLLGTRRALDFLSLDKTLIDRVVDPVRERGLALATQLEHRQGSACRWLENAAELLALTDLLVDGPYLRDRPETGRRWIGSANQRIHFLSDRYRADDPRWLLPNTLEIRLRGRELSVNGFPARPATGLWKRPRARGAGAPYRPE